MLVLAFSVQLVSFAAKPVEKEKINLKKEKNKLAMQIRQEVFLAVDFNSIPVNESTGIKIVFKVLDNGCIEVLEVYGHNTDLAQKIKHILNTCNLNANLALAGNGYILPVIYTRISD